MSFRIDNNNIRYSEPPEARPPSIKVLKQKCSDIAGDIKCTQLTLITRGYHQVLREIARTELEIENEIQKIDFALQYFYAKNDLDELREIKTRLATLKDQCAENRQVVEKYEARRLRDASLDTRIKFLGINQFAAINLFSNTKF
jgi:Mg2+ and Co2+ transporter CorA